MCFKHASVSNGRFQCIECYKHALFMGEHQRLASSRILPSLRQLRRWINFVIATEEATSGQGGGKD